MAELQKPENIPLADQGNPGSIARLPHNSRNDKLANHPTAIIQSGNHSGDFSIEDAHPSDPGTCILKSLEF